MTAAAPSPNRLRTGASLALLLLLSASVACRRPAPAPPSRPQAPAVVPAERAREQLEPLISAGRVGRLTHPHFAEFGDEALAVYAARDFELLWSKGGVATPQANALAQFVATASDRGLEPSDYDGPSWAGWLAGSKGLSPAQRAELDLALTVTALRIVSDLHGGRVNPKDVEFTIEAGSGPLDRTTFVLELAKSADAARELELVEPRYPGYQRLIAALRQYRAMDKDAEGIVVSEMKVVEPGTEYADLPKLVLLLRELGDMPAGEAPDAESTLYAGPVVDAVKRFQTRHGIDADGRIGPATFRAINTPLRWRVRQIELTLERWRWAPRRFPRPPIIVNIPEYSLRGFDGEGRPAVDMRVVVGRALRTPTPVMSGTIDSIVFQPFWNVPYSILKGEVLPELDAAYLEKHDMEIVDLSGRRQELGDAALAGLRAGKLRVRQRPGMKNSLGPVKFDFANQHSIYLHGTPAQALFARSRRDFSHGCIRVEDPERLAAWLLRDEPAWTREAIRKALAGGATQRVKLANPTPVMILYGTAVVMEDGEVRFFDDIYGIDKVLDVALAKPRWEAPSRRQPEALVAATQ